MTVTGTPTIALTVGTTSRIASYASGSGSASLVFRYIVQAGDIDSDGVALGMLSGGTILNSGGLNSVLTLNGVGSTLDILVDASTVPSAPDNVSATASDGAVVITFTPPDNGGSAISEYVATFVRSGATHTVSGTDTTSSMTISGLDNGSTYSFTVAAVNVHGAGPDSNASNPVTPRATRASPSTIRGRRPSGQRRH